MALIHQRPSAFSSCVPVRQAKEGLPVCFYSPRWVGYIRALGRDLNYGMDVVKHQDLWEEHRLHFDETIQIQQTSSWEHSSSSLARSLGGAAEVMVVKISTHHEVAGGGRYWWRAEGGQLFQVSQMHQGSSFALVDWDADISRSNRSSHQGTSSSKYRCVLKVVGQEVYVSVINQSTVRAACRNSRWPAQWEHLEVQLIGRAHEQGT